MHHSSAFRYPSVLTEVPSFESFPRGYFGSPRFRDPYRRSAVTFSQRISPIRRLAGSPLLSSIFVSRTSIGKSLHPATADIHSVFVLDTLDANQLYCFH